MTQKSRKSQSDLRLFLIYNLGKLLTQPSSYSNAVKKMEISSVELQKKINAGEKLMIEFHGVWCGPCKLMKPIFEKIAKENIRIINQRTRAPCVSSGALLWPSSSCFDWVTIF